MKSLVQVLILIKEEYNNHPTSGMCLAAMSLLRRKEITVSEGILFADEWAKTVRRKKRFYECSGNLTSNKTEWGWKVGDKKGRNNWLNHRIGKYS